MIRFENVTKQFGPEAYALKEVSFEVDPGEFIFLTGPSGSGKTTIMRLLTREYVPTDGDIHFDDSRLSALKRSKVHLHRRKIGVVFQDYKLLPELNVWENIALALNIIGKNQEEIESRVTDLLRLVNLVDKAYLFPNQLSGGEAQRVSIARALATGPSVIFADEPTGNLDPDTSLTIARLLKKINELGTTILLATHDIGVLQALPEMRRLHLEKGSLVEDTHAKKTKAKKAPKENEKKNDEEESADDTETPAKKVVDETEESQESSPKKGFKLGWPFGQKKDYDDHEALLDHSKNSSEGDDLHGATDPTKKNKDSNHHVDVKVESLEE